jgi:hypothetical protein
MMDTQIPCIFYFGLCFIELKRLYIIIERRILWKAGMQGFHEKLIAIQGDQNRKASLQMEN